MSQAYEVTVEDVENVLASNPLEIPLAPGETLEERAAELGVNIATTKGSAKGTDKGNMSKPNRLT